MKILHVCETVKGGLASYLNELVPAQQKALGANNVCLLVPDTHKDCLIGMGNIHTFKRLNRKSGLIHLVVAYIRDMWVIRPDIVHVHSTFAGVIVRMLRPFFFYTPIIYCPHGWAMDMEQSSVRKTIIEKLEWLLSFFCEKIIAISEYERKGGIAAGIRADKLITVYNGIAAKVPAFTSITWEDERLKVLFVGRFDRQKGVDVLLEAVAPLQNEITLKLVGEAVAGDETFDMSCYPFAEQLGWLQVPEISAWLAQCDVAVVPSRWEGFGLVAIEAMRMGKPVIASKVGGLAEILTDGESGVYVPPNDSEALRQALQSLGKNTLAQMGRSGRNRFLERLTSEKTIAQVMSLYETVLCARPRWQTATKGN
ncbi:MAG: glycosyltransferase family 1 protein [Alphaproteobacteria bacterium CG_4_9_14_3_um_filter_47_13]|nr:MAG: glycosyltransferase family 1 protein [Alphaproteobacteria bacterium CG_4_9_14_3_um_filter_47_13]